VDASTLEFLERFLAEGLHDSILTLLTFRPEFQTPSSPVTSFALRGDGRPFHLGARRSRSSPSRFSFDSFGRKRR
jgi:hypothetical protein